MVRVPLLSPPKQFILGGQVLAERALKRAI
jgi:hypothetical protein